MLKFSSLACFTEKKKNFFIVILLLEVYIFSSGLY